MDGERLLERFLRLNEAALLLRGMRPALEQAGALGVAGRGKPEGLFQALLGAFDIERKRPLAGEREVADRRCPKLLLLLRAARGSAELERRQIVLGEHVGEILDLVPRL